MDSLSLKRKPPEELERLKRENFERAAPGLENPDEVKQMLGLAYGGIATPKRGLVDEPGSYGGNDFKGQKYFTDELGKERRTEGFKKF